MMRFKMSVFETWLIPKKQKSKILWWLEEENKKRNSIIHNQKIKSVCVFTYVIVAIEISTGSSKGENFEKEN